MNGSYGYALLQELNYERNVMRKIMIFSFVLLASFSASAQGVHLGPGDSLSIGFNGNLGCIQTEFTPPGASVSVFFSDNILEPGDSLRLEMFENNLNEPPVAMQTYTATSPVNSVNLGTIPETWFDGQGLIRITMNSGSVDLGSAQFFVSPNFLLRCETTVIVPEPSILLLAALGGIATAVSRLLLCRESR